MRRLAVAFRMSSALAAIVLGSTVTTCLGKSGTAPEVAIDPVAALPSCGARTDLFTVSPIALADFHGWVPLGNLNPPLHTFPSPHQYLYHTLAGGALHTVPVVAPGNIVVIAVSRRIMTADQRKDYTVQFASCREVTGYFNHVATLDLSLDAHIGPYDRFCFTTSGVAGYTDCTSHDISIPVAAGAAIGTAGGVPGLLAWDFGLRDARVAPIAYANPSRWNYGPQHFDLLHVVAASDYYAEPVRSQIAARLGRGDGTDKRTVPPLGGTLDTDVAGTAQGTWFNIAQLAGTEGPHLALVPDNVDPTEFAMSGSESLTTFSSSIGYWRPLTSGLVNRDPRTIVADGQIRCVNLLNGRSALLLLADATTLRVEWRPSGVNCAAQQPWAFSAAAFDFHR